MKLKTLRHKAMRAVEKNRLALVSATEHDLTDEDGPRLANALLKNTHLMTLNLSKNRVGPATAIMMSEALAQHTQLLTLNLSDNALDEEGAAAIAAALTSRSTAIETLSMARCWVGDEGARALATALAVNTSLRTLDVSGNRMTDAAAAMLGLTLGRHNSTLRHLNLAENRLSTRGARSLASAVTKATAAKRHTLSSLRLSGKLSLHIPDLLGLTKAGHATILELGGLSKLTAHARYVARALLSLSGDRELQAVLDAQQADEPVDHAEDWTWESPSPPLVYEWEAAKSGRIVHTRASIAAQLADPTQLGVNPLQFGSERLAAEGWKRRLRERQGVACALALAFCAGCLRVNKVTLEFRMLLRDASDNGAAAVAKMLARNTTLRILSLSGAEIGMRGSELLARSLERNVSLSVLNLAGCRLGCDSASRLANFLPVARLAALDLTHCDIGDAGAAAFGRALPKATALKALRLSHNGRIGDAGAIVLAQGLARPSGRLRLMWLDNTAIAHPGAVALASALLFNTSLVELSLDSTGVDNAAARELFASLRRNRSLSFLSLERCDISAGLRIAIRDAQLGNQTLARVALPAVIEKPPEGGEQNDSDTSSATSADSLDEARVKIDTTETTAGAQPDVDDSIVCAKHFFNGDAAELHVVDTTGVGVYMYADAKGCDAVLVAVATLWLAVVATAGFAAVVLAATLLFLDSGIREVPQWLIVALGVIAVCWPHLDAKVRGWQKRRSPTAVDEWWLVWQPFAAVLAPLRKAFSSVVDEVTIDVRQPAPLPRQYVSTKQPFVLASVLLVPASFVCAFAVAERTQSLALSSTTDGSDVSQGDWWVDAAFIVLATSGALLLAVAESQMQFRCDLLASARVLGRVCEAEHRLAGGTQPGRLGVATLPLSTAATEARILAQHGEMKSPFEKIEAVQDKTTVLEEPSAAGGAGGPGVGGPTGPLPAAEGAAEGRRVPIHRDPVYARLYHAGTFVGGLERLAMESDDEDDDSTSQLSSLLESAELRFHGSRDDGTDDVSLDTLVPPPAPVRRSLLLCAGQRHPEITPLPVLPRSAWTDDARADAATGEFSEEEATLVKLSEADWSRSDDADDVVELKTPTSLLGHSYGDPDRWQEPGLVTDESGKRGMVFGMLVLVYRIVELVSRSALVGWTVAAAVQYHEMMWLAGWLSVSFALSLATVMLFPAWRLCSNCCRRYRQMCCQKHGRLPRRSKPASRTDGLHVQLSKACESLAVALLATFVHPGTAVTSPINWLRERPEQLLPSWVLLAGRVVEEAALLSWLFVRSSSSPFDDAGDESSSILRKLSVAFAVRLFFTVLYAVSGSSSVTTAAAGGSGSTRRQDR